jgi:ketosteroid isomerase-like protein
MKLSVRPVRDEVRAVVEAQLAAFRQDDYAAAFALAAAEIRARMSVRVYEAMVKRGYPALARHQRADLSLPRDDGAGHAEVLVTLSDATAHRTVFRYRLMVENGAWRVSGLVPDGQSRRSDT